MSTEQRDEHRAKNEIVRTWMEQCVHAGNLPLQLTMDQFFRPFMDCSKTWNRSQTGLTGGQAFCGGGGTIMHRHDTEEEYGAVGIGPNKQHQAAGTRGRIHGPNGRFGDQRLVWIR